MCFYQSSEILASAQNLFPPSFNCESIGIGNNKMKRFILGLLAIRGGITEKDVHQLVPLF